MRHITSIAALLGLLILGAAPTAAAAEQWTEGVNYFLTPRARPAVALPKGKVEVTEVFSYGCPACNAFQPTMHKLAKSLPENAVLDYVSASFNAPEDWPMFQRAYYTALALGVAEKTHDAMFDAVWKNRTLATFDPSMGRLVEHMPTIEDAAKFYNKVAGVPVQTFLDKANKDFSVDTNIRNAEAFIETCRVASTPTIVVNGKYRLDARSADPVNGSPDQLIALVNWLVAKESH